MGRVHDRLRRLEERFRDRALTLEEIQAVWGRVAERARAKLRDEDMDEGQRARDRDTVKRRANGEAADLDTEAERTR